MRTRLEKPKNLMLPRKTTLSILIPCLYLTADIYLHQIPACTLCRRRKKPCIRYAHSASGVCEACHFGKVKCSHTVLTHGEEVYKEGHPTTCQTFKDHSLATSTFCRSPIPYYQCNWAKPIIQLCGSH